MQYAYATEKRQVQSENLKMRITFFSSIKKFAFHRGKYHFFKRVAQITILRFWRTLKTNSKIMNTNFYKLYLTTQLTNIYMTIIVFRVSATNFMHMHFLVVILLYSV